MPSRNNRRWQLTFKIRSVYQLVGQEEQQKVKFWEDLEGLIQEITQWEKINKLKGEVNGDERRGGRVHIGFHGEYGTGD